MSTNQPTPDKAPAMAAAEKPTCGNCCNALRQPHRIGHVLCTALPPHVMSMRDRDGTPMGQNVRPEMNANQLGCTAFWGVNGQVFHALIAGVELLLRASGQASGEHGAQVPQPDSPNTGGKPGSNPAGIL